MKIIIHSITPRYFKIADDVRTRCGKSANVHSSGVGAAHLIDEAGNQFYGTTHREIVTCKKCINLLTVGTIHERRPSRAADRQKRAVARAG